MASNSMRCTFAFVAEDERELSLSAGEVVSAAGKPSLQTFSVVFVKTSLFDDPPFLV